MKIQLTEEDYAVLVEKAEKWDALAKEVARFVQEDPEGEGGDLLDIGEACAHAFGWL
jgi:hypothetical protein